MAKEFPRGFRTGFPAGDKGFEPSVWRPYFLNFSAAFWQHEKSAAILFDEPPKLRYQLSAMYFVGLGFILDYARIPLLDRSQRTSHFAVGDPAGLADFVEVEDEIRMPHGFLVTPAIAWLAVEDFLNAPQHCSPRLDWIAGNEVAWPKSLD